MDDDYDDEEHAPLPLDRREAARVRADLEDLRAFRRTFEPDGFKGVSMWCQDCGEEHFYEWDMLENNLRALLQSGETPVHEPAFDPKPEEYVDWEYAHGYVDGLADSGVEPVGLPANDGNCNFCNGPLPAAGDGELGPMFCPTCGQHLGVARLARGLLDRGWASEDVAALLAGAGLPPLRGL